MRDTTLSVDDVRAALNDVVDPCSLRSGVPAGLVDMGLVGDVDVTGSADDGFRVSLSVGVTEPGCLMLGPFATSARERLLDLPGVVEVSVSLRPWTSWSEDELSDDYRRRLDQERAHRRARRNLPLVQETA